MNETEKQLDLLGLFHFILGGLTALFACLPLIHVGVGAALLLGTFDSGEAAPRFVGWIFVLMGSLFVLGGWALAAAMIAAGRMLRRRKSRTACQVIAALECLLMPLGTLLGVFTLMALSQDRAQELFDAPPPAPPAA
ncbi:MAG: hypothetical protein PHR34_03095 [Kiritimatiellae bacterium]|nr:hypothetical protein [Kiritimatiellia bacterium]